MEVMFVSALDMHVKLYARDAALLAAAGVQVVAMKAELHQLPLELLRVNAKINQRADQHVAADPAEDVEIQSFHLLTH